MASRCIRLTRIHAIQWFGYCDTFDIEGNLLIAGRTGAGKSVLMDLIQLVLIGDQRAKYNAASDGRGNPSGRDKKSYCLCDMQEDIEGVPQYARDGGVTYIALEFTWPDGKQVETWGMRVEYANAESQSPDEDFFRIPQRLDRADFVTEEGFALGMDGYRSLLRRADGEMYRNVTEYRKRLAEHLNFHRETVDFLMPSAMSFAFLPRFDEFCRRYILQAEDIKIEPIQQSYRSYLRIREELERLQDKVVRLRQTVEIHQEWDEGRRDAEACRYLEAEFRREAERGRVTELSEKLDRLRARQAEVQAEFDRAAQDHEAKSQDLNALKDLFRDEGGGVMLMLQDQIREKVKEIARLQQVAETAEAEIARRVRLTHDFAAYAEGFLVERGERGAGELRQEVAQMEIASPGELRPLLKRVAAAVVDLQTRVRASVREDAEKFEKAHAELCELQAQLKNLESNRVMASPLLDELNRQLPRREGEGGPAARQLRELCEVNDETWRPALEVAFTRKFAIVVSPEDYPQALRIYKAMQKESAHESLVDPERALARQPRVADGSLATKINSQHPVARAVLDELFGSVICVDDLDDLRKHSDAIMADGFRQRGLFAERPRRYDQRPCIGVKGIEKLRAHLTAQADECAAQKRAIDPMLTRADQIARKATDQRIDSDDIEADLSSAARLRELEEERDRLIQRNTAAATPELEERLSHIKSLESEVRLLDQTRLNLSGRLQSRECSDTERQLEEAQRRCERVEADYDQTMLSIAATVDVGRCTEVRESVVAQYPTDDARANYTRQRYAELEIRLPEIGRNLHLLRESLVDKHPDLRAEPDFDPDTEWNPSYRHLLERITVEDMPLRQQQALEEEHRWQDLFRTTVAARLMQSLGRVRDTIRDLNYQLNKPIGDSQYKIRVDENPAKEFQDYRRVLEVCTLAEDGESIFASLSTEAREGVDRVFQALVEEPEGKLARGFLDYRSYYRYDMEVTDPKQPELPAKSLNKHADKFSGGEKQTPFYISILACYLRAYKRHLPLRYTEPSIGLVPIDEAFSKMSGERITDAIRALRDVELQGILSMSSGNWPYAIGECDQILAVHQREASINGRKSIRNIGALLNRQEALERSEDWE